MRRVSMLFCSFQCTKQKSITIGIYPFGDAKFVNFYCIISKNIKIQILQGLVFFTDILYKGFYKGRLQL